MGNVGNGKNPSSCCQVSNLFVWLRLLALFSPHSEYLSHFGWSVSRGKFMFSLFMENGLCVCPAFHCPSGVWVSHLWVASFHADSSWLIIQLINVAYAGILASFEYFWFSFSMHLSWPHAEDSFLEGETWKIHQVCPIPSWAPGVCKDSVKIISPAWWPETLELVQLKTYQPRRASHQVCTPMRNNQCLPYFQTGWFVT